MAPQLARAAATAREMLIDRAAAQWQVDRATLTARDGRIVVAADERASPIGELTQGTEARRRVAADAGCHAGAQWALRGTAGSQSRRPRLRHRPHGYTPDLVRPGMLLWLRRAAARATARRSRRSTTARRARSPASRSFATANSSASSRRPSGRRAAPRQALEARVDARRPAQPSSRRCTSTSSERRRPGRRPRRRRRAHAATSPARTSAARVVRRELSHSLHRARAARAARGGRRMDRRKAHRLDRHAAAVRRARRSSRARFRFAEDRVRVIVPDTGSGYGGKHTGEHAVEAARLAQGRRAAGEAGLDAARRSSPGATSGRPASSTSRPPSTRPGSSRRGSSTTGTPAIPASRRRTTMPNQRDRLSSRPIRRFGRAPTAGSRRPPITTRARCTWTRSRARSAWTRWSSGCGISRTSGCARC